MGQDEAGKADRGQTTKCFEVLVQDFCHDSMIQRAMGSLDGVYPGKSHIQIVVLKYRTACHAGNRLQVKEGRSGNGDK